MSHPDADPPDSAMWTPSIGGEGEGGSLLGATADSDHDRVRVEELIIF